MSGKSRFNIFNKIPSANHSINAPQILLPNHKGKEKAVDHNQIELLDSENTRTAKIESWIATKVGTHLIEKFPLREWGVRVDVKGRMIIIVCESVSITRGYHIHMQGKNIHQLCEAAEYAGAEILERHGITRDKKYNPDTTEALERDFSGDMIGGDNG